MAGNTSLTRTYNRIFTIMRDEAIEPYLFDNISSRTALLYCLKEKGAIKKVQGTPHLRFNILKELPTTEGYTDLDTITPVRADPATSVIYDWKQLQCPVQVSGLDMIKTGEGAEPDLLEMFIQAAEISMRDGIGGSSIGIYSSGADSDTGKITGLQTHFTSSSTTGQLGNVSRATLSAWRHQTADVSNAFDTNGLIRMRTLYRQCSRADEVPDIVVLNGSTWDNFNRELTSSYQVNQPIAVNEVGPGNKMMLEAGFPNIQFYGATLFHDDGVPANAGYFINTDYVQLYVREGRDAEISDFIKSSDKDDLVAYVFWAGNLINKNLARGGVLLNCDTY